MNKGLSVPDFDQSDVDRFWGKVLKTSSDGGCWEWQGMIGKTGYGFFWIKRRNVKASRVSYFISTGINPNNFFVLHKCDNRKCVNPEHLFLGTHDDNMLDRKLKGRNPAGENSSPKKYADSYLKLRGEGSPNTKLTNEQALAIRLSSESFRTLGEKYGISKRTVGRIKNKVTFKHIQND